MKKQMKSEQGITLIALVVTIVVLLILAAISIGMLTGKNGVITQTQKAREETIIADEKEILSLSYYSCMQENMLETLVTNDQLQQELDNNKRDTTVISWGENLEVEFNDTNHKYIIYQDGRIEQIKSPSTNIDMKNIFKYDVENGQIIILGVKDEYLEPFETGKNIEQKNRIASLNNIYIADINKPSLKKLVEEVGTNLEVPEMIDGYTVIAISYQAFAGIINLESIIIPDTVTSMGNAIFYDCYNLKNVKLSNSVERLGTLFFGDCTKLTNVTIPNSVISIGDEAFYGCTGITNVTIPNSVTSIEDEAFYGCTGITNVTIPNSVTNIEYKAFSGCTGITNIKIPDSVIEMGGYVFEFWTETQIINCETTTKPNGWDEDWDAYTYEVFDGIILRKAQLNWGVEHL